MKSVFLLALSISVMLSPSAWSDSLALPEPEKLTDGELNAQRGGAPTPDERSTTAGVQGSNQSAVPAAKAMATGAGAILKNGIGGPLGGSGGLGTILGGKIDSARLSFGQ